jgi:predicted nuclease of predicted toxin-antitoxin system
VKFLVDESIDEEVIDVLRIEGHSVLSVSEIKPSIADTEVMAIANSESALLLTADKDFGELIFLQGFPSYGVVFIRLAELSLISQMNRISTVINNHSDNLIGKFTVITKDRVRIRSCI